MRHECFRTGAVLEVNVDGRCPECGYAFQPVDFARLAFEQYAAMDAPQLPGVPSDGSQTWQHNLAALQVQLARWQANNFGAGDTSDLALGVDEEAGELAEAVEEFLDAYELSRRALRVQARAGKLSHAVLKHRQGIRGMESFHALQLAAGDAAADCMVYCIQVMTALRLDAGEMLTRTAREVMQRDWAKRRRTG